MAAQEQVLAELNEGTRAEQLAAQRAECARLDASHSSIQVLMDESRLVAPYPAMISRRLADEGTITAPGEPLFRIVEIAALEARVGVPPELIPYLIDAQQHELEVNGNLRQARLKAALPELDSTTRTRTVVFELMPSAALSTTTTAQTRQRAIRLQAMRSARSCDYKSHNPSSNRASGCRFQR